MDTEFIAVGFRFWLMVVLIVAGLSKLGKRREVEEAVLGYRLLPEQLAPAVAAGLPPLELALGALLAAGVAIRTVTTVLVLLLAVFTSAVALNLARGKQIDCGCFGWGIPRAITWRTVARNIALMVMAATVALRAPRALALDNLLFGTKGTTSHLDGLAALIIVSAALALVALALDTKRLRLAMLRTARALA